MLSFQLTEIFHKGKTTILRTVVGRVNLDSGSVTVLGKEPGSKGHQIPGLNTFSIMEPF